MYIYMYFQVGVTQLQRTVARQHACIAVDTCILHVSIIRSFSCASCSSASVKKIKFGPGNNYLLKKNFLSFHLNIITA